MSAAGILFPLELLELLALRTEFQWSSGNLDNLTSVVPKL